MYVLPGPVGAAFVYIGRCRQLRTRPYMLSYSMYIVFTYVCKIIVYFIVLKLLYRPQIIHIIKLGPFSFCLVFIYVHFINSYLLFTNREKKIIFSLKKW